MTCVDLLVVFYKSYGSKKSSKSKPLMFAAVHSSSPVNSKQHAYLSI